MDYWLTERSIFSSPWRRRLETTSISRTSHIKETNTIKTGSKWQGHLVTSLAITAAWCNWRWMNGSLWAPGQVSGPEENHSHTHACCTHILQLSFLPCSPPNKILTVKGAAGSFIAVSGLPESKSEMDVFLWELALSRRKETTTPIQTCINLWRSGDWRQAKLAKDSVGKS